MSDKKIKLEFAMINSEENLIPQDGNQHDETNASDPSDSSEESDQKNKEEIKAQSKAEDKVPKQDDTSTDDSYHGINIGTKNNQNNGTNIGKNNGKPNDNKSVVADKKNKALEHMSTQVEAMRSYVPVVGLLGWTAYLQALGDDFKNEEKRCDKFRIWIQWIYLSICFIIAFVYYMRQSELINNHFEYRRRLGRKTKVYKWTYVISHVIVTMLYLLTIDEQPFACHLPYPTKPVSKRASYEDQSKYLRYIQLAVVFLTTATLQAFHAASTDPDDPDPDPKPHPPPDPQPHPQPDPKPAPEPDTLEIGGVPKKQKEAVNNYAE